MITDARELENGARVEADICIVGAGPAGISLALELEASHHKVVLLESGGFESEGATQALYEGENVGRDYIPLIAARARYFGGSSNHWTGQCRPLDPLDFEQRDWVPNSGWPFGRKELDPFYERAQRWCQLGPYEYDFGKWEIPQDMLVPIQGKFENALYQFGPPTRFGAVYRDRLAKADNLRVILHANAVEILVDEQARHCNSLAVAVLDGPRITVSARAFVLAMGGIENPRLMLLSNRVAPKGVGNDRDRVGRYFMEHPEFDSGIWLPTDTASSLRFYNEKSDVDGHLVLGFIAPTEKLLREERLVNCAIRLDPDFQAYPRAGSVSYLKKTLGNFEWPDDLGTHLSNIVSDLDAIADASIKTVTGTKRNYFDSHPPYQAVRLMNFLEPVPNPDSRVTLGEELDALGQRRVRLDWRLTDIERHSLVRTHELLGQELGRLGLGRLKVELERERWPEEVHWGYHHMGTTRMHADPQQGVVDPQCRVHGVDNLFVAGSSVFPAAGFTNPTLTIVALAVRLADHLKGSLS